MHWLDELLGAFGLTKAPFIAGFIGGVISLRFVKELQGTVGSLIAISGGAVTGGYVSPWIVDYWHLSASAVGALGFLIGMFGLSLASALYVVITTSDWKAMLASLLSRRG